MFCFLYPDNHDVKYTRNLLKAIVSLTLTWVVILLTSVAMAILMTLLGRNMSWFTNSYNLIPLFVLPQCATAIVFHMFLRDSVFKVKVYY